MALGRNHRIFNIGNSSGSYGISRVYHDSTLSGDGTLSSLLGVVDAGDTEVNEFVYNNSGDIIDVNNVVQSNSGEWGNGGESYTALTSNSANWNEVSSKLDASAFDPNDFYPMTGNPSGFLTAVDLSDVVLNSAINYYRPEYGVSGISGRELYAISSKYAALDEHGHGLIEPYNYINNNSARIGDVVLNYEQTSASYVVVNNNSANWNDISAYQQNSANYLTAHQSLDGYATTAWVEEQGYLTAHQDISNKLDASAFSDVSGTFLTAVPAGYATTGEVNSVSSILSAAIDAQSGNVYTGIDPIVVNNDDKAISANTWAFSAGDGISFVDDNVNKITRIDVTAAGGNPEVESYVVNNSATIDDVNTTYQNASGNYLTAIPNTVSINVLSASQRVRVGSNNINYSHLDGAGFYFKNGNDRPYNIGIDSTASNFYIATAHNGYARIYASSISGWNDVLNTYQTASSTYLTAINIPTSADWNESTNVVQTNSGTWNGVSSKLDTSAFTLSALNDASANNIVLTASLPATPDANTLYLIPEV